MTFLVASCLEEILCLQGLDGAQFILFLFSLISFFSKGKVFVILAFFKKGVSSLCHMLFQHIWTSLIGTGTCNVPSVFLGSGLVQDLLDT